MTLSRTTTTMLLAFLSATTGLADSAEKRNASEEKSADRALMKSLLGDDPLQPAQADVPATNAGESSDKPPSKKSVPASRGGSSQGNQQLSEYARATQRLREELQTAQDHINEGQTGKPTQSAQAEAIAATERLIELAKQAARSSSDSRDSPSNSSTSSPSGAEGGSGAAGNRQASSNAAARQAAGAESEPSPGDQNRPGKARESSQRPAESREASLDFTRFRTTVIERSWGHLPERMRTRLLNGGTERSLPRYETLVDRYFESLVRPRSDDPANVDVEQSHGNR